MFAIRRNAITASRYIQSINSSGLHTALNSLVIGSRHKSCVLKSERCLLNKYCQGDFIGASYVPKRFMWRMLNAVFNRPDRNRIKEVGADRACAEWLLRCGAHVKWKGAERLQTDYNSLPATDFKRYRIEEVHADNAAVMDIGFEHFENVEHVKKIKFHFCPYLEDSAIIQLTRLKNSLEHLEITSCGDVTEEGLESLLQLENLKTLLLRDLPGVRNKEKIALKLQKGLPGCQIDFPDLNNPT